MNRHSNAPAPRVLLLGALVCVSLCWAAPALAQSNEAKHEFDIPALPLSQALREFSKQATLQYGYIPNDPAEEKIVVHAVKGRYTVQQALAILLPDGFTFAWVNSRTISVLSPPANAPPGGVNEAVAAKDQPRSEMSEGQRLSMANGGGKEGSARGPYAFDWEMTVEGRRLDSVFGSLDLDVPATVFDRKDIEASGVSTLSDLFRYLPQQLHTMPESYLGDGTQFADLRGLGFDTTLVLINGRRTIATASALTANAFDLNSIPPAAVERIEIVSDSNSAAYGADAIGGIVNIVLRKGIPEPRLDIDYGAADGGSVERHGAFSMWGARGRAWGSVVVDYFDRSPLLGRERARWNDQDFTRFDSTDWRSPTASPGNVSSTTLANLPGLSSSFAAIPVARAGITLTPADFVSTAGQRNLESLSRYSAITDATSRKTVVGQAGYELTPQISAYGEFLYVDREFAARFEPPAIAGAMVSGSNPYNPFGVDVLVDTLLTDVGPRRFVRRSEMVRAAVGIRGRIREWDWDSSLLNTQDDASTVQSNELDQARVATALAASDRGEALNLFGANSPALLASLLAEPLDSQYRTELSQFVTSLQGPLASLPAGPLKLTTGGEWRAERIRYDIAAPLDVAGLHERSIVAGFAELRLPLVGQAAQVPAMRELSLILSGRLDDYSDIGQAFNPEYALIWRPASALTVRTSFAKSFRPPPLFDLHMPRTDVPGLIADPARNGDFAAPVFIVGGNADLKPSNAESWSVGLQLEPRLPSALRLAANYWRIVADETIIIPSASRLLAAEDLFPGRIIRGPPSSLDVAAGLPGPLQVIDIRRMNNGAVRTSGVDVNASVDFDTAVGRFKPELAATWVHEFETSNLVDGPNVSRVGVANLQGTVPKWRAVATLNWNHGGFGISSAMRYLPSYDDVDLVGSRNGRKVGSMTTFDVQLSLDLGAIAEERSPWQGFEVRAGAFNVFDATPAFAEVSGPAGYDTSQGDLRQRFAYLKVAKKF
ncbi:MAG TPA: TonB-dependent receptor [Steroidobacteraceae bacterium]|nr:TonB-dependent receptor [Steroidobacteraceae bacterium]